MALKDKSHQATKKIGWNLSEFWRDLEVKSHVGIWAEIQKTKSKNQSRAEKALFGFLWPKIGRNAKKYFLKIKLEW